MIILPIWYNFREGHDIDNENKKMKTMAMTTMTLMKKTKVIAVMT